MALRIGRVVIESADFVVSVSLPAWTPTEEEERVQHTQNAEALHRFLQRLEAALGPRKEVEVPEHREMDEFEWERFLKQSDARSTQFGELLEKYHDHPDRDTIIAKAMGWEQYPPFVRHRTPGYE